MGLMKSLRNKFSRLKLAYKFFIIYFLIFFLITSSLVVFSITILNNYTNRESGMMMNAAIKQKEKQIQSNIDFYAFVCQSILDEINYINNDIERDKQFINIIQNDKTLQSAINKAVTAGNDIASIKVYTNNDNLIKNMIYCFDIGQFTDVEILPNNISEYAYCDIIYSASDEDRENPMMRIVIGNANTTNGSKILVEAVIEISVFDNAFDNQSLQFYLLDDLEDESLASQTEYINEFSVVVNDREMKLFILLVQDEEIRTGLVEKRLFITWVVAIGVYILIIIFTTIWFRNKVMHINRNLENIRTGNFTKLKKRKYLYADEFTVIENQIVEISYTLDKILKDINKTQILKDKAELLFFNSQFDSHFLYNILSNMNWMSINAGADDISELIVSLSDYYKLSLNKGQDILSIGQELEIIDNYLNIQRYNYSNDIQITYNVPEELKEVRILKLIITPLVENAVIHGIYESGVSGEIIISIWCEKDKIYIAVSDDGRGIDNIIIAEDSSQYDNLSSIGIIDRRIKSYYGYEYGLKIESNVSGGTRSLVILPRRIIMD